MEDTISITLDWIVDKVSNSLENKIENVSQCVSINIDDNSIEEKSCRICYDLTLLPIIYPCRCKVTEGEQNNFFFILYL